MSLLASLLSLAAPAAIAPPPIQREFRGVWVATVDNIDWPSKRNLSTAKQKAELIRILAAAAGLKLNAVVFQVRPSADALYQSRFEPWSEYLTGRQGRAPKPFYDPLEFAVEEAHKRGLELHCWFNPYRANHPAQKGPLHPSHIAKTDPQIVRKYGRYLWMDPGEPAVQRRSLEVVRDVVRRYDIDGVHIDDYFYPYKEKNQDFPDTLSYNAYRSRGGQLGRNDWRRRNVDDFVKALYEMIKQEKRWVKFGISPFGIYRPGIPAGIKAGVDQYADLYADARKWLVEGWCDYYTPQLYWPVRQQPQSYPVLLDWWMRQNPKGRHVWPGNFTSRTNPSEGNWKPAEVLEQIAITRDRGANGNVHYSMKALSRNFNGISDALRGGPYANSALPPATPWLDDRAPSEPRLERDESANTFRWQAEGAERPMWWAVWRRYEGRWVSVVLPGQKSSLAVEPAIAGRSLDYFGVAAVDRDGNMSEVSSWTR
jgi:uncharacterized lipoprotein YddW (UPF0748 family)